MKNIINKLQQENKLFSNQIVAIKNSKSWGQLAPGLNAIMINNEFEGFLWSVEEITHNRFNGTNYWTIIYSAMFSNYTFREQDDKNINRLYLKEGEIPTTISFGRRHGEDYNYVLTDNWGRPTKFHLVQIEPEYIPLIYSLVPELIIHNWNGKVKYRDIFVPKKVLYPYTEDNEPVLCCTYDPSLGYISSYWDGEMVYWKSNKQRIHVDWCFLPKNKEELINRINSKKTEVEEPTEDEYTSSNEEPRKRRPRKSSN
jgi:hypothetical protein